VETGIISSLARAYVFIHTPSIVGLDSSVGISTRYGLDMSGIESWWEARFSATGPEGPPASYTMGTESFPGVKRPGHGADHPPPSSALVKEKSIAIHQFLLRAFVASYRVNFTFHSF